MPEILSLARDRTLAAWRSGAIPPLIPAQKTEDKLSRRMAQDKWATIKRAVRRQNAAVLHRHQQGPKKLLGYWARRRPNWPWPAASTASEILKRAGLIQPHRRRRRRAHPGRGKIEIISANDLWMADFKGEFLTDDRRYCYPLTVADRCSRYLLGCEGQLSTAHASAQPVFEKLFSKKGLPQAILSDNGSPFRSTALAGLSRLSVWWIKLGIQPVLIDLGHPEQNDAHERMHRTLKAETARPPAANLTAQQGYFNAFRKEFNHERPHEALDQRPPAEFYQASPRPYPRRCRR